MRHDILSVVGRKIRELRIERKMSLVEVAAKSDITAGLLSRIENFRTLPSLPVLHQISIALDVPLAEIVFPLKAANTQGYTLIKAGHGDHEDRYDSEGLRYINIVSRLIHNQVVKVNVITVEPKAQRPPLTNDGYELVYVLKGSVQYRINDSTLELKRGDTLLFDGAIPHSVHNLSSKQAELFKVYFMGVNGL